MGSFCWLIRLTLLSIPPPSLEALQQWLSRQLNNSLSFTFRRDSASSVNKLALLLMQIELADSKTVQASPTSPQTWES